MQLTSAAGNSLQLPGAALSNNMGLSTVGGGSGSLQLTQQQQQQQVGLAVNTATRPTGLKQLGAAPTGQQVLVQTASAGAAGSQVPGQQLLMTGGGIQGGGRGTVQQGGGRGAPAQLVVATNSPRPRPGQVSFFLINQTNKLIIHYPVWCSVVLHLSTNIILILYSFNLY